MSDTITLVRLESSGAPHIYGSEWSRVAHVIDKESARLGINKSHHYFTNLPGPCGDRAQRDYHVLVMAWGLDGIIGIRKHERCACVDLDQLYTWWPSWSLHALAHKDASHDIHLRIIEADPDRVRIGKEQAVYAQADDSTSRMIRLAGMGGDELDALLLEVLPRKFDNWEIFEDRIRARDQVRYQMEVRDATVQF